MKKQLFYVANFKSYLTFDEEVKWCKDNMQDITIMGQKHNVIVCPSGVSLSLINQALKETQIKLGAQDCSRFNLGAYTGEVSAESLSELNVKYCIVGHNERRQYFNDTNEIIKNKIERLFNNNIIPIICIGETIEQYKQGKTKEVLKEQLNILKASTIIIAYEPVWAIGSGIVPSLEYINDIYDFVNNLMDNKHKILYGGSVNQDLAKKLKKFTKIDGFLVGKASTDFQEFKKIVL